MTITIHLAPEEEAKLSQKAVREGSNAESVAHDVLVQALDWETQDRAEAVEGIQRGIEAFDQGRFRRFSDFESEQRASGVCHGLKSEAESPLSRGQKTRCR